jgi:phosphoglycerol transferase
MPLQTPADAGERPAEDAASAAGGRQLARDRSWLTDAAWALGAALVSLVALTWVMRLWRGDLSIPFVYEFDGLWHGELVKSIVDHGWYQVNNNLGAPFGQRLYDVPQNADNLQLLIIRAISEVASGYGTVINLYYLLSFPLIVVSAFFVLRRLGISPAVAGCCSVLFALAPYHFLRRELHLFLSGYYAVPLGAYLFLTVLAGGALFARRAAPARGVLAFASRRTLITLAMCAVIGSASIYYAGFTLVLVTAAVALALIAGRDRKRALGGALAIAAIVAMLAVNLAPAVVYRIEHGANTQVAQRSETEAERYQLKLTQLVLPVSDHRLKPLARLKERYRRETTTPGYFNESYSAALGVVAAVGFASLLLVALLRLAGARAELVQEPRYGHAAAGALLAFLIATFGGISTLIAYYVTPQLRAWNRLSIFISFFSFLAVALALDALRRRLAIRRANVAFGAVLAAVLVIGVLDQTTPVDVPQYRQLKAQFRSDDAFVRGIERRLPRGASVFQLPYMGFPESKTIHRMYIYSAARGYLHSHHLRWSYGAMQGRPADWSLDLSDKPVSLVLPAVAAAGFDGIYLDRDGYADSGRAVETALARLGAGRPVLSRQRDLAFFDLRSYRSHLRTSRSAAELRALAGATLHPRIGTAWTSGFRRGQQGERGYARAAAGQAALQVDNRSRRPRAAVFTATIRPLSAGVTSVHVRYPDGSSATVRLFPTGAKLRRSLLLAPGRSRLRVAALPAQQGPQAQREFDDAAVLDPAFLPFLGG